MLLDGSEQKKRLAAIAFAVRDHAKYEDYEQEILQRMREIKELRSSKRLNRRHPGDHDGMTDYECLFTASRKPRSTSKYETVKEINPDTGILETVVRPLPRGEIVRAKLRLQSAQEEFKVT